MEETQKKVRQTTQTPKNQGIIINKVNYSYLITKSKNKENSLLIQLYEPNQKSNIYFTYEAPMQQIINEVKFLSLYESLDEIIDCLNDIFFQGNVLVEEKNGVYVMELYVIGIKKKYTIKLNKHEIKQPKEQKSGLESKFKTIETYLNDLYNKYEELKVIRKKEIKDIVKEVIFDDDILFKLFEKMKRISSSKYKSVHDNNINNDIENNIMNKVKAAVNNKESKINNQINIIQQQLQDNINYVNNIESNNNNNNKNIKSNNNNNNNIKSNNNNIKSNNNNNIKSNNNNNINNNINNNNNNKSKDNNIIISNNNNGNNIKNNIINNNYIISNNNNKNSINKNIINNNNNCIILQVKIGQTDLNEDIILFNQVRTLELYHVFDKGNFETIIDNKIVDIKAKSGGYYWNFKTTGMHIIKIIFNKKLLQSNGLFNSCKKIYKIDCSNLDCSQITDCSWMFCWCFSLTEINFGKLDFALSNDFTGMFSGCRELEKLDVSSFKTNKSKSFSYMFCNCSKLKEINLSTFKTTNCKNISNMLEKCFSLKTIDLSSWDFKNMNNINYLFCGCKNLTRIRMSFNNNIKMYFKHVFDGLPKSGSFIFDKELDCKRLLKELPLNWDKIIE